MTKPHKINKTQTKTGKWSNQTSRELNTPINGKLMLNKKTTKKNK